MHSPLRSPTEHARFRRRCASNAPRSAAPSADARVRLKAGCACGGGCPRCHTSAAAALSSPQDHDEREADRIAARITGTALTPEPVTKADGNVQSAPAHLAPGRPSSSGQPLRASERSLFEQHLGTDLGDVRLHTDASAARSAESLGALAYTIGEDVVFNTGQYRPDTPAGRNLLAHELVHVGQHTEGNKLRRQTVTASCNEQRDEIEAAWRRAQELLPRTIEAIERIRGLVAEEGGPRRIYPHGANCLEITFGDMGLSGGQTVVFGFRTLLERFRAIDRAFQTGRNIRCDVETVPNNECTWRSAFVVTGNDTDIFLCPNFFASDQTVVKRAVTLIHEMAHSALHAGHRGIAEHTYPLTFFDYTSPLGLELDDALRNAFAYEIFVDCMYGEPPTSDVQVPSPARTRPDAPGSSVSLGALGGLSIAPGSGGPSRLQGLAGIAGRYLFRPGDAVIVNPFIGLSALYSPTTSDTPEGFFAGVAEGGVRLQQPREGFYFDISGGPYVGFEAPLHESLRPSGGLTGAIGLGARFRHFELGPEARILGSLSSHTDASGRIPDPLRALVLLRLSGSF